MTKVIDNSRKYDGYIKVDKVTVEHKSKQFSLERIERGHSVALLIVDTNTGECLLTSQFRPAVMDEMEGPVAGMIDEGETPEEAIVRECKEETGIEIEQDNLIYLGTHYLSAGILTEKTSCYVIFMSLKSVEDHYEVNNAGENEYITVIKRSMLDLLHQDNKQASLSLCLSGALLELSK
tara:strand:+ start:1395 stop:1931 length:537 start_codon:yes stop_codon:yes gene_type:complete